MVKTAGGPITKSIDASKSTLDWDNRIIPFIFGGPLVNNELGGVADHPHFFAAGTAGFTDRLQCFANFWMVGLAADAQLG